MAAIEFLKVLVNRENAKVDIVLIHGLNPTGGIDHAETTWTENGTMWPRDLLTINLPEARILLFGYNANVAFDPSTEGVRGHAHSLLVELDLERQNAVNRPIVFICHSLGGLILKRALVIAQTTKDYMPIRNATWGLVFFGTPHHGGNLVNLGKFVAAVVRTFRGGQKNPLLQTLESNGYMTEELAQDFRQEIERYNIISFYETKGMKVLGRDFGLIVERSSAVFDLSIDREKTLSLNADHSGICKFASRDAEGYKKVEGLIVKMAKEAIMAGEKAIQKADQEGVMLGQIQIINIDVRQNGIFSNLESRIAKVMDQLLDQANDRRQEKSIARRSEITAWLAAPSPTSMYYMAQEKCLKDTGLWFTRSQSFYTWTENCNSWLWLYGQPGCGKTVLNSNIVSVLENTNSSIVGGYRAVVYYYFDFSDDVNRTREKMIRSLIEQLDTQHDQLSPALDKLFTSTKNGRRQPSLAQMLSTLHLMLQEFDEVFMFLDALEECSDIDNLLKDIKKIESWSLEGLHVLITSRNEVKIEVCLERFIPAECRIRMESAIIDIDIQLYLEEELEVGRLEEWSDDNTAMELIKCELMKKACGMFRWVDCQLDVLKEDCKSIEDLRLALNALPRGLDETYSRILHKIRAAFQPRVYRILRWLAYSRRPLQEEELSEVVTIRGDEDDIAANLSFNAEARLRKSRDILEICSSLVTLVTDAKTKTSQIKLAHFTVQEYLESSRIPQGPGTVWPRGLQPKSSNMAIARICLSYLFLFDKSDSLSKDTVKEFPLAKYAAEYWTSHARFDCHDTKLLDKQLESLFLEHKYALANWIRLFNPDAPQEGSQISKPLNDISTPLYYAAFSGLHFPIRKLIDLGSDINALGGFAGNALHAACSGGVEDTVQLLLNLNADVNCRIKRFIMPGIYDKEHDALHVASCKGHTSIVRLLLKAGADVNSEGGLYGNALQAAAYYGFDEIVTVLLDAGANIDEVGGRFDTALIAASWSNLERTTKLLIFRGACVNTKGPNFGTALQAAANDGNEGVVKILLENGADIHAVAGGSNWYGTALQAAAGTGWLAIVRFLLEKGADTNQKGGKYGTALNAAAGRGHIDVVEFLLENGADPQLGGATYANAIQAVQAEEFSAARSALRVLRTWYQDHNLIDD